MTFFIRYTQGKFSRTERVTAAVPPLTINQVVDLLRWPESKPLPTGAHVRVMGIVEGRA